VIIDFSAMFEMNYAATYLGLIDAVAAYEVSRLSPADDYRRHFRRERTTTRGRRPLDSVC